MTEQEQKAFDQMRDALLGLLLSHAMPSSVCKERPAHDAAYAALTAANAVSAEQYSIDADPQGIRARVVSAVVGAMAYGARGENKPPEGHWLNEAWDIARAEANRVQPQAKGEAERLYDAIEACLLNHRLHNFMEDDESHYPLVDHLSHGDSIEDGRHEIRLICDSIYNTVLKPAHPQATEPAGWKLVPVEPTQEMLDAVVTTVDDHLLGPDAERQYREDWASLLAAAPEAHHDK